MPTLTIFDKASRLIEYATGERYGDGYTVHDIVTGYAEPGYGDDTTVVVLGDWNDKRQPDPLDLNRRWHSNPDMPGRLARSLERIGAEIEWHDEWTQCHGCWRAVRTSPDSYGWKPSYRMDENGVYCHECLIDEGIDALTPYVNNDSHCVTWCEPSHVLSLGFTMWEPDDPHTYESGWHPGQTDTPQPILAEILAAHPTAQVVFFLDTVSQFDIRWSAYFLIPDSATTEME